MSFGALLGGVADGFRAGYQLGMESENQKFRQRYLEWEQGFKTDREAYDRNRDSIGDAKDDRRMAQDDRRLDLTERQIQQREDAARDKAEQGVLSPEFQAEATGKYGAAPPANEPAGPEDAPDATDISAPGGREAIPVQKASFTLDSPTEAVRTAGRANSLVDGWYQGMQDQGLSPMHAAVFAGNVQQESGGRGDALNAKEGAYGGIQWRLDRRDNLERMARQWGADPSDPAAQQRFAMWEMTEGPEKENGRRFLMAKTPEEANRALRGYIRYGDDSEGARLNYARAYLGGSGGSAMPGGGDAASPVAIPEASGEAIPTGQRDRLRDLALMEMATPEQQYAPPPEERDRFEPLPMLFAAKGGMVTGVSGARTAAIQAPTITPMPGGAAPRPMASAPVRQAVPTNPQSSYYDARVNQYAQMLANGRQQVGNYSADMAAFNAKQKELEEMQKVIDGQLQTMTTTLNGPRVGDTRNIGRPNTGAGTVERLMRFDDAGKPVWVPDGPWSTR